MPTVMKTREKHPGSCRKNDVFTPKTNITSRKQQERARATVKIILEHFEKEGFIKNASITADAITFEF